MPGAGQFNPNIATIPNHSDRAGNFPFVSMFGDLVSIKSKLKKHFKVVETTDKTSLLEKTENQFGYKGLHLQLKLRKKRGVDKNIEDYSSIVFELQIRTVIQDAWSILDHKIKYKKSIPHNLKRRINRLSALFEIADEEFLSIKKERNNFV